LSYNNGLEIVVHEKIAEKFDKLFEKSLNNVWDNAEDSEYDQISKSMMWLSLNSNNSENFSLQSCPT